ncbi:MFS transporter [Yinghuangia seranimata]|uniref:MFS transporter n=1 Tax=Yinghuangia seranimata TaxID=408067 RepID=UPI00248ADC24|nr:MFS transporter [Yinghuangia seranimata]MDI2126648.1 MFS transporter [Yinghuangia seranimata]
MRIYADLFRARYAARLLGGTLLGRLPNGMGALAILLLARADGASYGVAGALSALSGLATALGQPALGRWTDRRAGGQTAVLIGGAVVSALGYALFAVVGVDPLPVALAAVLVAGFATPPLESGLRALWPTVLRPDQIHAAYALDAASQEILFTVGPMIVVLVTAAFSEAAAVVVTGVLGIVGTLVVATSRPSRAWRGAAHTPHWAGPLRAPGLRVLLIALTLTGTALGVINVAAVAYADEHGRAVWAGAVMAAMSTGAFIGGVVHGARRWARPARERLPWLLGALTVGYLPLVWAPAPGVMLVLAVVSGLFLAPTIACAFTLVDELAPTGTVTEAFAWIVAAMGTGAAVGTAVAGFAGEVGGVRGAFAVAGVGAALGLAYLFAGRRKLVPAVIHSDETNARELVP